MHMPRHTVGLVLTSVLAGLALVPSAACQNVECGANTIEQNGKCVASGVKDPATECGPGTVYSTTSGRCENQVFASGGGVCGQNTSVVISDAGIRTCVGTGGGGSDCSVPLPCPAPTTPANVSLCGRIYDLEDSSPLDDGNAGNGEPWKTVELRVYDPIAFVASPAGAKAIVKSAPDACGRFAILEVERPANGFVAVATADASDAGGNPPPVSIFVLTGIAAPALGGDTLNGLRAWSFRRTTDEAWSTAAGLASGTTFGKLGVYIPIFVAGAAVAPFTAAPTAGVTITPIDQGVRTPHPSQDYYFDDPTPLARKTLSATRAATGANGTGLYIMSGLGQFSGLGAAPAGTCWAKDLAAAPTGGAYVQERSATAEFCP